MDVCWVISTLLVFSFLTHPLVGVSGCNNTAVALLVFQSLPVPKTKVLIVTQMRSSAAYGSSKIPGSTAAW